MRGILRAACVGVALAACAPSAPDPLEQATRACETGEGEARIAGCTTLIETEEASAAARVEAYARRAQARRDAGDVTAALRDYEAGLRLDETHVASLIGRAEILRASGQLDAALAMVERAAPSDTSGRAELLLGRIALLRGDHQGAITHLDAALGQDGDLAEAYAVRARAKKATNDLDGARADYSAAIQRDSALAEARAGRCWLSLEAGENLEQARDDAEAAVLADARNVDAQICRGVLQLRAREPEGALTSFAAALAVEPGNPEALFGHGIARMRTGDAQGSRDMNRARDFSEHVGQRYDQLGVQTW
jgi:tetratricopeptide (TPR) repeat protein